MGKCTELAIAVKDNNFNLPCIVLLEEVVQPVVNRNGLIFFPQVSPLFVSADSSLQN